MLDRNAKTKIGIWCYEWIGKNVLPTGFAKHYKSCDVLCPPSEFAKEIFIQSGIPSDRMKVIPHGIHKELFQQDTTIKLTDKKFKILTVLSQTHKRKNIAGLLEAYGKAFTNKDDVSLILKAKNKLIVNPFDVSLNECLKAFYQKYPEHAEIKVYSDFLEDMSILYRSVDCVYTMTHCEAFYFSSIEALAAGKMSVAPNYGGQLDALNDDNSFLVNGKEVKADPKSMYWESKSNALWFNPDVDDAAEKLRRAEREYLKINEALDKQRDRVYIKYDWGAVSEQFLKLCT
jgi:glycosyltransferase involved in cell wall biosynthesis